MRLPNGYGSVFKVEGRRNPWRAVTAAPDRKHVGYFGTKKEAVKALAQLAEDPATATLAQVYEKWKSEKFPTLSRTDHYEKAWSRMKPIQDKPMADLKLNDLEKTLDDANVAQSPRLTMKLLLLQLYEYGMKHDIVMKNYATYLNAKAPAPKKKTTFSKEEIRKLFEDNSKIAQMTLVSIYSGWRVAELLSYTIDGDIMRGGVKTKAGKDRIVPIHPKIKDFVEEYRMPYQTFHSAFMTLMDKLGMNHTPHECRHTFISMAKEKELNDDIIKLIVGHARKDITEGVYTHRTIESLKRTIAQVDWE